MNRLEKKCFVTAAAIHGLLFVILLVGPAFFKPSEKGDTFKQIDVYSAADITKALTSGGTPQNVRAIPLPPPPTPTPAVEQPKVETPRPPETPPEPKHQPKQSPREKPTDQGDEPVVKPKPKRQTMINADELVSNKNDANEAQKRAKDQARKKAAALAAADAKQRADDAKEFGNALRSLKDNLSGSTVVKMPVGNGMGGPAAANYRDIIASKFYNAWNPAFSLSEDTPDVTVSVTISRDGSCTGHITKHSGNSNMDKSVQNALEIVNFIEPFPASFTEQQMTVPIVFNLRVKRQ
jgi:TonB family protein